MRDPYFRDLPDAVTALAVTAYVHLLGAVSLELFGQFGPDATPAPAMFDYGLRVSAALLGLPASVETRLGPSGDPVDLVLDVPVPRRPRPTNRVWLTHA